jgi:alkylhydroperoxidase family enzyme
MNPSEKNLGVKRHSWIPRIDQHAMQAPLAQYLAPRVKRLGYLGEMFTVGANVPDVLFHFMNFTDALKDALPFDVSETVVLTVASIMGNHYERNQHQRLCLRNGLTREWIADVEAVEPDLAAQLSEQQRLAQRYVIAAFRSNGRACGPQFDALSNGFDAAQAMAIAFLVGRYITHALIVNTLELEPPVPSIFEDGFIP